MKIYAIIHFDHPDPNGDKPHAWVVDFVGFDFHGVGQKLKELQEASEGKITFYFVEGHSA